MVDRNEISEPRLSCNTWRIDDSKNKKSQFDDMHKAIQPESKAYSETFSGTLFPFKNSGSSSIGWTERTWRSSQRVKGQITFQIVLYMHTDHIHVL